MLTQPDRALAAAHANVEKIIGALEDLEPRLNNVRWNSSTSNRDRLRAAILELKILNDFTLTNWR